MWKRSDHSWSKFSLMVLSVIREAAEAKSRLAHISLLALNLRLMENWRSAQRAARSGVLDHESTMIVIATIVISTEKLLRTELDPQLQTVIQNLPYERLSKVNFSSIAAATGINRETVRRKANKLIEAGIMVRDERGIRMAAKLIEFDVFRELIEAQLDAVTRTVNQLSKLGVLVMNDSSDQ